MCFLSSIELCGNYGENTVIQTMYDKALSRAKRAHTESPPYRKCSGSPLQDETAVIVSNREEAGTECVLDIIDLLLVDTTLIGEDVCDKVTSG
jgi:hypothetical protein